MPLPLQADPFQGHLVEVMPGMVLAEGGMASLEISKQLQENQDGLCHPGECGGLCSLLTPTRQQKHCSHQRVWILPG